MRWLLTVLLVLALLGLAAAGGVMWGVKRLDAPGPMATATTLVIAKGADTGRRLADAGLVEYRWLFALATRLDRRHPLQAGEYEFPAHASMAQIIDLMQKGQVVIHKITIAEGLTVKQAMGVLRQAEAMVGRVEPPPEEGSLLPETYNYTYGEERAELVSRMQRAMGRTVDALWAKRPPDSMIAGKTEAIILASIVERETAVPAERPHIAAVFLNRLRRHMKLQSDPTVIYALSRGEGVLDRPLAHDDLSFASPYNTYVSDGLPPGPICNPGPASLAAVLHPANSDDLYFVADGGGGHVFARTLDEHNKNVARLRRLQNSPNRSAPTP